MFIIDKPTTLYDLKNTDEETFLRKAIEEVVLKWIEL